MSFTKFKAYTGFMKMNIASVVLLFSFSQLCFADVKAKASDYGFINGTVEFFAKGKPSGLKIHGTSKKLAGTVTIKNLEVTGSFSIPMADFSSGMSLRDSHMKDKIFKVSEYPEAKLTLKPFVAKFKEVNQFSATLNFQGIEKEIKGEVKLDQIENKLLIDSKFNLQLTYFNIKPPEFAGMKILDDVQVVMVSEGIAGKP